MPRFSSECRDGKGTLVKRVVEAQSHGEALRLLENDGLVPVKVDELRRSASIPSLEGNRPTANHGRVKSKELLAFSRQLGSLVTAGVPILVSLRSIGEQTSSVVLKAIIADLTRELEQGSTLSTALEAHPKTFPVVYTQTIRAGEESGSLDEMLHDLAEYLEAENELRSSVRSALLYPMIVIGTLTLAISALVIFVVPRFAEFYARSATELPLPTRILIGVSNWFTNYALLTAGILGLLTYGARKAIEHPRGRALLDRALLRVPILGRLMQTASTIRVAQMLGLFTRAGVPLLQGLETIATATSNSLLRGQLRQAASRISTGEGLTSSLTEAGCFEPTTRQMLAAGELAGSLEDACFNVASSLRRELAYLTKNLSIMIEPILTLVLAVVVLFVALAVFLPMWNMSGTLG